MQKLHTKTNLMELIAKRHLLLKLWLMVVVNSLILSRAAISAPLPCNVRLKLLEIALDKVIGKCLPTEEQSDCIVELKIEISSEFS